jgi:hypothetical protein
MEDYWKTRSSSTTTTPLAAAVTPSESHDMTTVESVFDRHCHLLLEQATLDRDAGWAAELRRYLKDVPDVLKSTDIIN